MNRGKDIKKMKIATKGDHMPVVFNAEEVFEIGIEIEKNGREFYKKAAEKADDAGFKKFLQDMAAWEETHISVFEKLRSALPVQSKAETLFDPDDQKQLYMKAAADSHIFRKSLNIAAMVDSCKTPRDMIRYAMQFEKDSVVLYNTMISLVPEHLGKKSIERLIDEEMKHITFLQEKMAAFR